MIILLSFLTRSRPEEREIKSLVYPRFIDAIFENHCDNLFYLRSEREREKLMIFISRGSIIANDTRDRDERGSLFGRTSKES